MAADGGPKPPKRFKDLPSVDADIRTTRLSATVRTGSNAFT
jgi:hypothetical protein